MPYVTRDDGVKIYWEDVGSPEGLRYEISATGDETAATQVAQAFRRPDEPEVAQAFRRPDEPEVAQAFRPAEAATEVAQAFRRAEAATEVAQAFRPAEAATQVAQAFRPADERPALLLIMGLGATLEWWQRLIPVLSPRYRTIVYDNRGVGRSDVPPGPYPIPAMADDAAAVMDAAGIASAHVFGASMGGMIAQELALNHPARVRSLILGCTACGGRQSVPASKEVAAALGARSTMTREEAMWLMAPHIFDAGTPRERVAEDIAVRLKATVSNDGYFAQLAGIRAWRGTHDRLGGIAMPTLVIHGETDELVPPENGRIIAAAIPGARLVMIPHASHIFFTDQLEATSGALLSFLAAQAPA